jgi:hypothetical protein
LAELLVLALALVPALVVEAVVVVEQLQQLLQQQVPPRNWRQHKC